MSIYESLGLRKVINASGKMTALGGSAVHPAVADAMAKAAGDFVEIEELMYKCGQIISEATGAPDGCPTTGAAAGISISIAAVIAGTDLDAIESLPFPATLKRQVILQKGHSVHFGAPISQLITLGGGQVVEVGHSNLVERSHIEGAINENTAALFYVKSHHAVQKGMQSLATLIDIGNKYGIPVLVDAAAEEDLKRYYRMGANLVIYSGGKAIGGPTCGLICGEAYLIAACRAQYKGIARTMKIGKEGMIGLIKALELYQMQNHSAREQFETMSEVTKKLCQLKGISARVIQDEAGREIYRAEVTVNEELAGISALDLVKNLENGPVAIYTRSHYANTGKFQIDPRPLLKGEEIRIVKRIQEILTAKE